MPDSAPRSRRFHRNGVSRFPAVRATFPPARPATICMPVQGCPLPDTALLRRYLREGAYADCYATTAPFPVTQTAFVEAFYTTRVFKLERAILAWFAARPSTDQEAHALAEGTTENFAAWHVETRLADQLLLCDFLGRTRSWLMTAPAPDGKTTRLYFGSAVVPMVDQRNGRARMGFSFRALLGFHRIYSRILLSAAARLVRAVPDDR